MKAHAKALAALLSGIGAWGTTAAAEGGISLSEGFGLLVVLGGALLVWYFPNQPPTEPK